MAQWGSPDRASPKTPGPFLSLGEGMQIFVFGSNLGGRHGKGAAKEALDYHGAIYGRGEGPQGNSYAIPTKGYKVNGRLPILPLNTIGYHVQKFLEYARRHPELTFNVTAIGCGLAAYLPEDIAPFFRGAPANCRLPERFVAVLRDKLLR